MFTPQQSSLVNYASGSNDNIYQSSTSTAQVNATYEPKIDMNDPMPGVTKAMAMLTNVVQQSYIRPTTTTFIHARTIVNVESIGKIGNATDSANNAGERNVGIKRKGIVTTGPRCFNCKGIGHIAQNYTESLRKRNFEFYKEVMLLVKKDKSRIDLTKEEYIENDINPTYDEEDGAGQQSDASYFDLLARSDTGEPEIKLHSNVA
ncbi:hypothetical protein Tco_1562819 [Tanacetum coccineum]